MHPKSNLMKKQLKKTSSFFYVFLSFGVFFSHVAVKAQSYMGTAMDNYAGIHSVIYNPANVFDSPFRTDINLVSFSSYLGNDFISVSLSDVAAGNFEFDESTHRYPSNSNHFFTNIDVLGPSFMFNVGDKQSFGFTTRVRGLFNLNNIDGTVYEGIDDGFDMEEDLNFEFENLNTTAHLYAEIGITYGRELLKTQDQFLKGGITLKYLSGAGGLFFKSDKINGDFNSTTNTLTTQGTVNYGSTPGFDFDSPQFDNRQGGFGADLGVVYEYRPRMLDGTVQGKRIQQYKFKGALAITDIGSINYANSESTTYDLNATIDADEFENKSTEEVLDDNYSSLTTTVKQKINLPTALQLMADYYIGNRWYVGLQSSLSLRNASKGYTNTTINTTTLVPRWESKFLSVYSPIGVRQYGGFAWGFGFRAGPLTIGSGSMLTNLFKKESKNLDIHLGLKIPLYKKITSANTGKTATN